MRMMIFLRTKLIVCLFILGALTPAISYPSVAGADLLCIKLSKKFRYLQKLNAKVSELIDKNRLLLKANPPAKISVKKKLNFVMTRLTLEKKKLKIKQEKAELALVKKKCPSYDVLSRFNL